MNEELDVEGNRVLSVIQSETQRMGRLIDELLNFSRLGRQQMKSSILDLTALAQSVFQELTGSSSDPAPQLKLGPLPPAILEAIAPGKPGELHRIGA